MSIIFFFIYIIYNIKIREIFGWKWAFHSSVTYNFVELFLFLWLHVLMSCNECIFKFKSHGLGKNSDVSLASRLHFNHALVGHITHITKRHLNTCILICALCILWILYSIKFSCKSFVATMSSYRDFYRYISTSSHCQCIMSVINLPLIPQFHQCIFYFFSTSFLWKKITKHSFNFIVDYCQTYSIFLIIYQNHEWSHIMFYLRTCQKKSVHNVE